MTKSRAININRILLGSGLLLAAVLLPMVAHAQIDSPLDDVGNCDGYPSLGQAICNVVISSERVPGLISGIAYLIGLIFGITGIFKLKEHVLYPDRIPIWDAGKLFIAGGALFALPTIAESVYNTIVGTGFGGLDPYNYTGFAAIASDGGLDSIVAALVKDLWQPMHIAMAGFGYIAGLVFVLIGILRIVKTAQDGPRGPGGFGTIMTFLTAGVLFSLDRVMGAFSNSTFGDETTSTAPLMLYTDGMDAVEVNHAHAVISSIIGFVAIVGWISFIRGWFIIRGVAEGNQQASLMAGVTHILGGALAVNLGPLMNAVQATFGLTDVGIAFI